MSRIIHVEYLHNLHWYIMDFGSAFEHNQEIASVINLLIFMDNHTCKSNVVLFLCHFALLFMTS